MEKIVLINETFAKKLLQKFKDYGILLMDKDSKMINPMEISEEYVIEKIFETAEEN